MRNFAHEIAETLLALQKEFGFKRIIFGTKEHYTREIAALKKAFTEKGCAFEFCLTRSFYPAGDEQVLIYEATGRTVPPGGLPLSIGVVVENVTTVRMIHDALQGKPVIAKFVTVTGAVKNPSIVKAPVGASLADCIEGAGGALAGSGVVIRGGPMMGKYFPLSQAADLTIGKADGGIIVLPADHYLATRSRKTIEQMLREARSACIQCCHCTEMCPRYLIGHKLRPNRVMRSFATATNEIDQTDALLCSECGVCEMFACPMGLSPRRINSYAKDLLRKKGAAITDRNVYPDYAVSREYRRVPQSRLIERLGIGAYPTQIDAFVEIAPAKVTIPLRHGVGKPSEAKVKVGDTVHTGDVIAGVKFEEAGCMIHASIDGVVTSLDNGIRIERK
jgi:Na+-translocating ferredoxin:NAD+ oxidoreductase RnfC subunit